MVSFSKWGEGYQLLFAIVEVERVDSILSMIHDIKVVISV
jgi:hypothetical protein